MRIIKEYEAGATYRLLGQEVAKPSLRYRNDKVSTLGWVMSDTLKHIFHWKLENLIITEYEYLGFPWIPGIHIES